MNGQSGMTKTIGAFSNSLSMSADFFLLPVGVFAKKNVKIYVNSLFLYIALSNRLGEHKGKHLIVHSGAD